MSSLPQSAGEFLSGRQVFCVGMKGTGMTSLAVMMKNAGAVVSGCDVAEVFMTDAILSDHGLSCRGTAAGRHQPSCPFFCLDSIPLSRSCLCWKTGYLYAFLSSDACLSFPDEPDVYCCWYTWKDYYDRLCGMVAVKTITAGIPIFLCFWLCRHGRFPAG